MRNCTLVGAKYILVDERLYCVNKNGKMNQNRAMQYCKELNAKLPLPVSSLEFEAFSKFSSPYTAWIGMSDPSNSGKKENWKDVQNEKPAYVKWDKTDPDGDGTAAYYNTTGVFDTDKSENHLVVCVQKLPCEFSLKFQNY